MNGCPPQIHFKKLEDPAAPPAVTLELLRGATYDEVGAPGFVCALPSENKN